MDLSLSHEPERVHARSRLDGPSLTLKITDGGAKTEEQRECLREVDPDGAQGFLVSREQRPSC